MSDEQTQDTQPQQDELVFSDYVRKPFTVQAVMLTTDNIAAAAPMIGQLDKKPDGTPFIEVDPKKVPHVNRVFPGFYLTKMGKRIHCYSPKAFANQFLEPYDGLVEWVNEMNEGDSKKK